MVEKQAIWCQLQEKQIASMLKITKMEEKSMILIGEEKKLYFYWKNFTFLAYLFRFMLVTLCGKYSETICVPDSIIEVWTWSLSTTEIVSEPHLSAKCEYGRVQIFPELMNWKSINNTLVAIYSEAASRKIFWDFSIILTLFLLTLNKLVLIKF